jgi:hypothetical protein
MAVSATAIVFVLSNETSRIMEENQPKTLKG